MSFLFSVFMDIRFRTEILYLPEASPVRVVWGPARRVLVKIWASLNWYVVRIPPFSVPMGTNLVVPVRTRGLSEKPNFAMVTSSSADAISFIFFQFKLLKHKGYSDLEWQLGKVWATKWTLKPVGNESLLELVFNLIKPEGVEGVTRCWKEEKATVALVVD